MAVPETISPLTWQSKVDGKREFKIKFRIPHPFHEAYKQDVDGYKIWSYSTQSPVLAQDMGLAGSNNNLTVERFSQVKAQKAFNLNQ